MLTAKGKYCLKALVCLAALEPGASMQGIEIAERYNIPKKFLDAILGDPPPFWLRLQQEGAPEAATCWLEPRARYESVTSFA